MVKIKTWLAGLLVAVSLMVALPAVANAYSSWWAFRDRCDWTYTNGQVVRTWYKVIDYSWYEEVVLGYKDFNYPTLLWRDHWGYINAWCTRA